MFRHLGCLIGAAVVLVAASSQAQAQTWRYDITSDPASVGVSPPATTSPCIGSCVAPTGAPPVGYVEILRPYTPDVNMALSGYNLSVGGLTFTPQNSTFRGYVRVNGAGQLNANSFTLTSGPITTATGPTDPAARVNAALFIGSQSFLRVNAYCTSRAGTDCMAYSTDQYSGEATALTSKSLPYDPPPPPVAVPTLSEWAMILLGLLLAGGAAVIVEQRRMTV